MQITLEVAIKSSLNVGRKLMSTRLIFIGTRANSIETQIHSISVRRNPKYVFSRKSFDVTRRLTPRFYESRKNISTLDRFESLPAAIEKKCAARIYFIVSLTNTMYKNGRNNLEIKPLPSRRLLDLA